MAGEDAHLAGAADAAGQERQLDHWQPVQSGPELLEQAALPGDLTLAVAGLTDQPGQGVAVEPGPGGRRGRRQGRRVPGQRGQPRPLARR